ncbi:TetR family transcriptional regulator [Sneathiella chungangensis]|uniref:TetR family transcriptional regulator n=1 Tax=Sneathiella chungangensis TaxID=1418234 RepID=A0A845MJ06_9PROT|nr:TetR/AcrR family transcriptional regulator [Sneathiella chungangensis]MZR23928.1 TetR family transcriptional regulator [Sneathiella chungangensis]
MSNSTKSKVRPRGRPRSEKLELEIIRATISILASVGYHEMTMELVATEAGSSRPAIYRRWKSKQELVVAALAKRFNDVIPIVVDTGSTQKDVATMLKSFLSLLRKDGMDQAILSIIPEIRRDDELGLLFKKIEIGRRLFLAKAIMRGKMRGDIDPNINVNLAIDQLLGGIYFRLIFRDGIPADKDVEDMVNALL